MSLQPWRQEGPGVVWLFPSSGAQLTNGEDLIPVTQQE